jgi:hypothetical protein
MTFSIFQLMAIPAFVVGILLLFDRTYRYMTSFNVINLWIKQLIKDNPRHKKEILYIRKLAGVGLIGLGLMLVFME